MIMATYFSYVPAAVLKAFSLVPEKDVRRWITEKLNNASKKAKEDKEETKTSAKNEEEETKISAKDDKAEEA